jgi:cobalamin biosynthesis Mg chelatase CobN
MDGMRPRPARRWGLFAVLSVSALLACACFPLLAQADSSGAVYEPELPTATGHSGGGGTASHGGSGGGATASQIKGSNHSGSSKNSSQGGSSPAKGGANGGGSGQGSPGNGSSGSPGAQPQGGTQTSAGAPASSGGGSSPLVPILIAIAALAAISIGAVAMQRRRQHRSGSSVRPEAG